MLKQICNNHNYIINLLNTYVLTNNVNNGIMNLKDENEAHVYKNEIRKSMTEPVRD
jgi:hypothetical protein